MHTIRAAAGSSPEIQEAQLWIMEAMDPTVAKSQLSDPGRFRRLDIMIATNLIEKFTKMRRNRNLSVHHNHLHYQINRVEFAAQNEKRPLAGREMIRVICYWCSVRSEVGQHHISRDIFKGVIDPNRPDDDLYHFYNAWTDVYQQLYGVRPPSDEMRASI
eukprot:2460161-Pyramimonas_sp.AAC.1